MNVSCLTGFLHDYLDVALSGWLIGWPRLRLLYCRRIIVYTLLTERLLAYTTRDRISYS